MEYKFQQPWLLICILVSLGYVQYVEGNTVEHGYNVYKIESGYFNQKFHKEGLMLKAFNQHQAHNAGLMGDNEGNVWFPCPTVRSRQCKCDPAILQVMCKSFQLRALPPGLPVITQRLVLDINFFTMLRNTTFVNFTALQRLSLNRNKITSIGLDTFTYLKNLTYLDLSSNPIPHGVLVNALFCAMPETSIRSLILINMTTTLFLTRNDLTCLQNTSLQELDVSANKHLCKMANGTFADLNKLKKFVFELNQCKMFNVFLFDPKSSLQKLMVRYNQISEFPTLYITKNRSYIIPLFPNITLLDLDSNKITILKQRFFRGQEHLETLRLQNNAISFLSEEVFVYLTSLKKLVLSENRIKYIHDRAFVSESLMYIILEQNPVKISHDNLFRYSPEIKAIDLSNLDFDDYGIVDYLFQNISSLEYLRLQGLRRLMQLTNSTFRGLYNLKSLCLTNNFISYIHFDMFEDLLSLTHLYLDANDLTMIDGTSFPTHLMSTLRTIALASNPWHCDCQLLWFLDWLNSTKITVLSLHTGHSVYKCATPYDKHNKPLLEVHLNDQVCLSETLSIYIQSAAIVNVCFVLLSFIISTLVRYRWHLRVKIFHFAMWLKMHKNVKPETERHYVFDAFVSYHNKDSHWVKTRLLPELEENTDSPLRLCLYERDWLVGHDIIDCIEESISLSRKTLLIVTNVFAQSQWCQLELTMAQHHLFEEGQHNLILAVMEDIEPLNMTPRLALEMKRRTYLEWTEDAVGQKLFWKKLKHSLTSPSVDVRRDIPADSEIIV